MRNGRLLFLAGGVIFFVATNTGLYLAISEFSGRPLAPKPQALPGHLEERWDRPHTFGTHTWDSDLNHGAEGLRGRVQPPQADVVPAVRTMAGAGATFQDAGVQPDGAMVDRASHGPPDGPQAAASHASSRTFEEGRIAGGGGIAGQGGPRGAEGAEVSGDVGQHAAVPQGPDRAGPAPLRTDVWQWRNLTSASMEGPAPRACHTLLHVDGYIYMVGGDPGHKLNREKVVQIYRWDLHRHTWSEQLVPEGTSPSGFYYHSATFADGNIYVFGGGKGHKKKSADLGKYTIHSNTWQLLSSGESGTPPSRYAHTTVAFGNHLYMFGGRCEGRKGDQNDLWSFSLQEGRWRRLDTPGPRPSPRAWHTAVSWGQQMYVYRAIVNSKDNTDELWTYSYTNNQWTGPVRPSSGPIPLPRHGHTAVLYEDSMLVFAGSTTWDLNDLWLYHFPTNRWQGPLTMSGDIPFPRYTHSAAMVSTTATLYMHGGTTGNMSHIRNGEFLAATLQKSSA
mmetsp:Transcript_62199/g.110881  ORF Transcript_62199/g.110881 Transcript_62199/m.110881 type:complete len:505 (-) Transcript_62199:699-2213(-)